MATGRRAPHYPESVMRDGWTFLSNHGHVLVCLAEDPSTRLRDIAVRVGITERSVQQIVTDLESGLIITRSREGRRNHYKIRRDGCFRHPLESGLTVGEFVDLVHSRAARPHRMSTAPRMTLGKEDAAS